MDDPGDPCWSWPHWKFGLKREDLFTKLHDQYNTVPSAIQDPEAFHHDVYEISNEATSTDEFHRLLQDRKEQRLRELNESLESAAFEIIANPSLIGTEQWQYAVQLFRTKSLDSLVRYYASYLPQSHPWHKPASSCSETSSTVDSIANSHGSFFDDGPIMTDEPLELGMPTSYKALLPPSPRSLTMCSDSSAGSPTGISHHDYDLNTLTPPRTLSYSESEPDLHEDFSQPCDLESSASSVSAVSDAANNDAIDNVIITTSADSQADTSCLFSQLDVVEAETPTPTPKLERQSVPFFEPKPSLPHRRHRSVSPSRPSPLSRCEAEIRDPRSTSPPMQLPRHRRVECMAVRRSRRIRGEPATCVRKPSPDGFRSRTRERRRVDR